MKQKIIIGTRGSKLALWQAQHIAARLGELNPGMVVELNHIVTTGDKILDVPLAQIGGKGLFTKELETAMLAGEIDLAVHSLKDMPTELPAGLVLAATTTRLDPHDAFVSRRYASLAELPAGATVGTSSLRRKAQLLRLRPDLRIENLRGNLDTRLRKLDEGQYDAIVLAAAGLRRLGWAERITAVLSPAECLPAVGQGVLAIEARAADAEVLAADWSPGHVGRWVDVALAHDGTRARLYVDGQQVAEATNAFAAQRQAELWIGRGHVNADLAFWRGGIDDVRIFRSALGTNELAAVNDWIDDADEDGWSNGEEFVAGTDPRNPASPP